MSIPVENRGDYNLTVPDELAGRRLDQALAELLPQYSRNRLQSWVKDGQVQVDGAAETEPKRKLRGGESVVVSAAPDIEALAEQAEDIPLSIVYEDDALLVIDKPAGLVVHPGSGNWSGTLMNALLHHCPAVEQVPRAGIVHRLDKETSGLLVVAKTLEAQTDLVRQLQARTVKRQYLAVAAGVLERDGRVEAPIGRHPVQRIKMAVVSEGRGGKPAVTRYRVLERFARCTLVECSLETGRTHQIRVHMAHLGHPLVGDPVYGRTDRQLPPFHRQALHAARLGLIHPVTGEAMHWEAPLPEDMRELLEKLRVA
ncbi:MAG: 23S rRNA pseudouridine(1911/1915/1917) synthase RluD [Actinomycetota bacterium]